MQRLTSFISFLDLWIDSLDYGNRKIEQNNYSLLSIGIINGANACGLPEIVIKYASWLVRLDNIEDTFKTNLTLSAGN